MSDKIDERIVEMSFDNKKFEKGISQSQKSLKDFNKSLQFDGATRGVESFSASFSKMGVVTLSVIQNLTNRIVNFGIKAVKSLTIGPVMEGMKDYNTKLTTMQTITNATGKTIAEVEVYFAQLDEYADKTIYNLTDMTSAMAKFTNAGVSLDKSTPAIKGIANMTALAGQNASAASIAMYNLSQSISGGFLNRMDFKSLELANVATIEWKQYMTDAAVAAGTLTKTTNGYATANGKAYTMQQLFVDGLQEQWATTDILLKVLGDYGDVTTDIGKKAQAAAQDVKSFGMMMETLRATIGTGWTRSFELIFGDLEEGKKLWTNITNAAGAFLDLIAKNRNLMLEFWHDNGGREAFINGMRNVAIAVVTVLLTISKAMDQIFPPKTQEQFVNMFKSFERITSMLIMNEETADKLRRTFAGLFGVLGIGVEVVKFFGGILGQVAQTFFPGFSGGLLGITANLGDVLAALHYVIANGELFGTMLGYTGVFIEGFANGLKNVFHAIVGFIAGLVDGSITIKDIGTALGNFVINIGDFISMLFQGQEVGTAFANTFKDVSIGIKDGVDNTGGLSAAFATALDNIRRFTSFVSASLLPVLGWIGEKIGNIGLKEVGVIAIGVGLIALSSTLLKAFSPLGKVFDGFASILTSVSGAIKSFTLSAKAEALFTIAKALSLLVVSIIALAMVPVDKLKTGLTALTIMLGELVIAMLLLNKIKDPAKIGMQLVGLSTGLFIIAKAAKRFEDMSWTGIAKAGVAIAGFLTIILVFMKLLDEKDVGKFQVKLVSFAIGIAALSGALLVLNKISPDALFQSIKSLGALLGILAVYSKLMDGRNFDQVSSGMAKFALGIVALTGALAILGNLSFGTLLQGSVALLALLSILALYAKMVDGKDWSYASKGLVGFGIGLIALTGALAILGNLPFGVLLKGSVALLAMLATLALFVKLTDGKDLAVTGGSLIGLGIGLLALSGALSVLGSLDFMVLAQGTIAITALMIAIGMFVKLSGGGKLGVTAGGMIAFSLGIGILSGVLALLTMLDTTALITAAGAISILITAIGLFSKLTNLGGLVQSALGLGIFAIALAALAIPIAIISQIPWQQLAATAGVIVLSIGMLALVAAAMPVFAGMGTLIGPALVGVLGAAAVVAEIGLLIAAFGGLAQIPGVTGIINDGGELLMSIGQAIGKFVGGVVGGVLEGVTNSLPAMADDISAFGVGIAPFFESIKGVDAAGVKSVKYLAETMLILGANAVVDSLTSWFTGGSSLTYFAAELKAFAPDFVSFASIIKAGNIDAGVVDTTVIVARSMAELNKTLPNQGKSVVSWFVGDNTLSVFAAELKSFAPDFVSFANTIAAGNIKASVADTTVIAATAMAKLNDILPNQGKSVASWFVGDNTLSVFAKELKSFAPDFVSFATVIKDGQVDGAVITKTASAAKTMAALATGLPTQGGVMSWIKGDNRLSVFAAELKSFAPDFVSFANTIATGNIKDNVSDATLVAAKAMSALATGLPDQGGMKTWFVGDNKLSDFASELVKFAPGFVEFAQEFGKIKGDTILPGIQALDLLVRTLSSTGELTMINIAAGFEANKPDTLARIETVLDGVAEEVKEYRHPIVEAGENIVNGLILGLKNKTWELRVATRKAIADNIKDTIATEFDMHSPAKEMIKDGKNVVQGLINGILKKKDDLMGTIKGMTGDMADGISGGSSLTSGLEELLGSLTSNFGTTGAEAGDAFGAGLNGSDLTSSLAGLTSDATGLGTGLTGTIEQVKTAFEAFKEWLDEEKFYGRLDISGEITAWETMQDLYKSGTKERTEIDRTLYTLRNQLIKETYQNEIDAIEKKNYYGQLSLEEELAKLRTIRAATDKNSEERTKINREIFALEKKIYETQKQYIDDIQAAQEKAANARLEAQREYNESVAEAEKEAGKNRKKAQEEHDEAIADAEKDAAKKRITANENYTKSTQSLFEGAAEDRIKLEEDLAKDIKDIQDKLLTDLESAERKYTDAVKTRSSAIYGYYNIFDEVSEREVTTPEALLKNLTDQNAAVEDWRYSLRQLEGRGVSDTLINELQDLGVSSSGQLSAMLAMTDEQLTEFVALFDRKHEIANTQAISELVDYRAEINDEISALYAQGDADITARMSKYNTSLSDMNATLQKELSKAQTTLDDSLTEINDTLSEKSLEAKATLGTALDDINSTLQEQLSKASTTFDTSMTQINQELTTQLKTLKTSFDTTMETVHDKSVKEYRALNKDLKQELEELNTESDTQLETLATTSDTKTSAASTAMAENIDAGSTDVKGTLADLNASVDSIFSTFEQSLYDVGLDGANGLASGLRAGEYLVRSAGQDIGLVALNAAKAALDEHSPSKEMEEVGRYADLGLINGLVKYASKVENAGSDVGQSAMNALTNTLLSLASLSLDVFDLNPTITPVLDLSTVLQGANALNSLLSSDRSYTMATNSLAQARKVAAVQNRSTQPVTTTTIYNSFKLEGVSVRSDADIDLIATKLYQKQEAASRGHGARTTISTGRR